MYRIAVLLLPSTVGAQAIHTEAALLGVDDIAAVRTLGPHPSRPLGGLVLDEQPRLGNRGATEGTIAEGIGCHATGVDGACDMLRPIFV